METITSELVSKLGQQLKKDYLQNKNILSFYEYLDLVAQDPVLQTRGSAQYLTNMMDFFGTEETEEGTRFKVFDMEFSDPKFRVVGQLSTQNQIYSAVKNFVKEGVNNRLVLLHGPNGSAKSTLIQCLVKGLEHYSQKPEGALYRFNWIIPVEKSLKQGFGLASQGGREVNTYARLNDEDIAAKIPCDLKDHPLLVLPLEIRAQILKEFFEKKTSEKQSNIFNLPDYLVKGSLSHKSHQIFEALLSKYQGDLQKILMHIQVERFYVSKRYRTAAVTIEPQMHVDGQSRQVTADRSLAFLPPSLQSISLYELLGDLPDANRGLVDFADLLKRPVDAFKYLLVACEQGSIGIGSILASLDLLFFGSTNELQLDAFKEFPDFTSFKARIELIRVPYILSYSEEQKIYDVQIQKIAGDKHVTPHTTHAIALWAVLTRLKKPNPSTYSSNLTEIIAKITPLEKAKMYNNGELPPFLTAEQKKLVKAALDRIKTEYNNVPYYEGRVGASARELKTILYQAAQDPEFSCLSPLAVFRQLEEFIKRISEYEFLKQDIRDGYHDCQEFITTVRNEYLQVLDEEVRESMGIFEKNQYEDYLKKYIVHLSHLLKNERIKNTITGKMDSPDESLLEGFEAIIDAPKAGKERDTFRNNIIASIGAYSLDHPNAPFVYRNVFPDFMKKLENHYFDQQKAQMQNLHNAVALLGSNKDNINTEATKLARKTVDTMKAQFHYCEDCAKNSILFLIKSRY